jgi:hypothetical protein
MKAGPLCDLPDVWESPDSIDDEKWNEGNEKRSDGERFRPAIPIIVAKEDEQDVTRENS